MRDTNLPIEVRLLTKVVDERDFHSLEKAQITEQYFAIPECIELYRYLKEVFHHPSTVGQVPSRELVQERFPAFAPAPSNDSVSVLAQELRKEKVRIELLALCQNIQVEANTSPMTAKATLLAEASKISALAEVGEDITLAGAFQTLLTNYNTVQNSGGVIGIPFPWHILNEETQGKLNEQFIVLYGRPGSMKSFLAIYMACYDYMFSRRRVVYYTREMSPLLVAQRMAACIAGVSYKAFKNGQLQPELKNRTFQILQDLLEDERSAGAITGNQPGMYIISDRSATGGGGVNWLRSKLRDIRPHIAYVDGMYLMKDDRSNQRTVDWKALTAVSQDLKLAAQEFQIPLIGITQANRNAQKTHGTDLTELSYTDALGQDADVVCRVTKRDRIGEDKIKRTELWLKFPKIREGAMHGFVIGGEPCTDFEFKRALIGGEEEEDDGPPKQQTNNSPSRPSGPRFSGSIGSPRIPLKKG